jgi:hypothetical protein
MSDLSRRSRFIVSVKFSSQLVYKYSVLADDRKFSEIKIISILLSFVRSASRLCLPVNLHKYRNRKKRKKKRRPHLEKFL